MMARYAAFVLYLFLLPGLFLMANESREKAEGAIESSPLSLLNSFSVDGAGGAEYDGEYYYASDLTSGSITVYDASGSIQESFSIPSVPGLTDLSYDGSSMYGVDGSNTIYEMDFAAKSLSATITAPAATAMIAYDASSDAFWLGAAEGDLFQANRNGDLLNTISADDHTLSAMKGAALDNWSPGGPFLWIYTDINRPTGNNQILVPINLTSGTPSGLAYNTDPDLGGEQTAGGGIFAVEGDIANSVIIGGISAGPENILFNYEYLGQFFTPLQVSVFPTSPPLLIPAEGGRVAVTWQITSNSLQPQVFDIWGDLQRPNGSIIRGYNRARTYNINPGATIQRFLKRNMPGRYAGGEYIYYLHIGSYPLVPIDTDTLRFFKEPPAAALNTTPVHVSNNNIPAVTSLAKNYPNPFNPSTHIDFQLQSGEMVNLSIYNTLGQKIATLAEGFREAGHYSVVWDGRHASGQPAPSGIYIYRLTAGNYTQSFKMFLMK